MVTSPRLYALGVQINLFSPQGDANHSWEALLELVKSYSPGLKEIVCASRSIRYKNMLWVGRNGLDREQWPGLLVERPAASNSSTKRALTSLTVFESSGMKTGHERYQDWDKSTNLEMLRTLNFEQCPNVEALRWMAGNIKFTSLSCLRLHLSGFEAGVDAFLSSLPSLKTFHLRVLDSDISKIPLAILENHGSVLRSLSLLSTLDPAQLHSILTRCPVLEHLETAISRLEGNADEVAMYRRLGLHSRLDTISLTLDCTVYIQEVLTFCKTWENEQLDTPRTLHDIARKRGLRGSLINCALDRNLAIEIFKCVASSKPVGASALKCVKMRVSSAGVAVVSEHGITRLARARYLRNDILLANLKPLFGHFWNLIASRHPRDDCLGEVLVEQGWAAGKKRLTDADRDGVSKNVEPVFRTLWPKGESDDPRNDWRSFPLAE